MSTTTSRLARPLYLLNAIVAGLAVTVSFALMATGYYLDQIDPTKPTLLGNIPTGKDQIWERFFDWISYFTILSNITVTIVMLALTFRPELFTRTDSVGKRWQALRLDSLLMISITGIVYQALLAGGEKVGWDFISNALQHIVNPIVTVLVFLIVGPRGLINRRTIAAAMVVPLVWAVAALTRGLVIGAYPYFFLDVATNGLLAVVEFILAILVFAVIIALIFMAYDKLISRRQAR
jgi:hypothetical protein